MSTKHTLDPWCANVNEFQGLVISEVTGANIAVTYDPNDAFLVAAAPELLDVLLRAGFAIEALDGTSVENEKLVDDYRYVINNAKGIKQ